MSRNKSKARDRKDLAGSNVERARIAENAWKQSPLGKAIDGEYAALADSLGEPARLLFRLYGLTGAEVYKDAFQDLCKRGYSGLDWQDKINEDLGVWRDPALGNALELMDRHIANGESERGAAERAAFQFGYVHGRTSMESLADYLRKAYAENPGPDRWPGRSKAAAGMQPPGRYLNLVDTVEWLAARAEKHGLDVVAELNTFMAAAEVVMEKEGVGFEEPKRPPRRKAKAK